MLRSEELTSQAPRSLYASRYRRRSIKYAKKVKEYVDRWVGAGNNGSTEWYVEEKEEYATRITFYSPLHEMLARS
jgi:hypothetical protein